jgi:hypothetical protein
VHGLHPVQGGVLPTVEEGSETGRKILHKSQGSECCVVPLLGSSAVDSSDANVEEGQYVLWDSAFITDFVRLLQI